MFIVGALICRQRGKGPIGRKIPENRENPRKVRKIPKRTQKNIKGHERKDKSRSGNPRLKHPCLAARNEVGDGCNHFDMYLDTGP